MPVTPIFDSLTHPTLTGNWFDLKGHAGFETLVQQLKEQSFNGACAVGVDDVEGYDHKEFINQCKTFSQLFPVAGFNPMTSGSVSEELEKIKAMGYGAIKIHPRFNNFDVEHPSFLATLKMAANINLVVFYCTFYAAKLNNYPKKDPFWVLVNALQESPDTKIVLLHGGVTELLRYSELARFNPNLLLDLSYTMVRYQFSSLDADIKYLFQSLDQRVCIGSDHPEISQKQLRERFEYFSGDIPVAKKENIGYKNIMHFLGIA